MADATHDAVVIVPGIMGSALKETATGRLLWGLQGTAWLKAWTRGDGLLPLHLDEDERAGRYGRITPAGLLRFPAWAPVLKGFEPYSRLVQAVRGKVVHPAAVLEFAYDWRLPVEHNGRLLAEAAHRHLTAWRTHDAHTAARDVYGDGRPARLVFICHSMGGLVTRAAFAHATASGSSLDADTRAVITLGTPFHGSAKTTVILNGNRSDPLPVLPPGRMQALAATLPGVHDLLPGYRCIDAGMDGHHLTAADVEAIGGDRDLAQVALDFQHRMRSVALPGHRAVAGVAQPTVQTIRIDAGIVHEQYEAFETNRDGELARHRATGIPIRRNRAGDGTVYRDMATVPGAIETGMALQHGALAKGSDALAYIRTVLTEYDKDRGPALGPGGIGLELPDSADAGKPWWLRIHPAPDETLDTYAGLSCTLHDAESDRLLATPRLGWHDGTVAARITLPAPGLYRVRVDTGGPAAVTQLVLATHPDLAHDDSHNT
ncbi:esterase/lipase family protein [Streptomyces sp. NPDC093250]|uniref:esterase/lipase family protein n=1 Tax=unclassified Streptomyces TaxID=2593676 RepID=UPI003414CA3C